MPRLVRIVAAAALLMLIGGAETLAHPLSDSNASFVQGTQGPAVAPFMYLGAKHMVTGTDHVLFLVGVVFFLFRLRDIVLYVSLFTIGHSATLLAGVLWGFSVNTYAIDAIIGLSVVYKAFENLGGFERVFGVRPNTQAAVLVFGLFHGLGLATRLQEFTLAPNGLVINLVSFNVGVEIGQMIALTAVLIALTFWRTRHGFFRHAFVANALLMTSGFVLAGSQTVGYLLSR